jgi:hypothetical protein
MYKCGWNGCEKAYGTLNHLNAHVTMQSHGQKRTPEGMLDSVHNVGVYGLRKRVTFQLLPHHFLHSRSIWSACRSWSIVLASFAVVHGLLVVVHVACLHSTAFLHFTLGRGFDVHVYTKLFVHVSTSTLVNSGIPSQVLAGDFHWRLR